MTPEQLLDKIFQSYLNGYGDKTMGIELIRQAKNEWCKEQRELLKKAVVLIKGWHNMGIPDNDLAEETWKIYYNNAPEMKEIREYLNTPEP